MTGTGVLRCLLGYPAMSLLRTLNGRKYLKFSIRGIPVLPILTMAVSLGFAALVATSSVSNSLVIQSAFSIALRTYSGGVCTATPFTTFDFGTRAGQTAFNLNSTTFCIVNTSNSPVFIRGGSAYTVGAGTPSGSTVTIRDSGVDIKSQTSMSLAAGASYFGTAGLAINLVLSGTEPAGSYSWTVTVNAFDVSTP